MPPCCSAAALRQARCAHAQLGIPACAVYLLIQQLEDTDADPTWSKVTATVFDFLIMMLLLSGANAAVFG